MFTNQRVLGLILLTFVLGAVIYFGFVRFQKEVSNATIPISPTPTPQALDFLFNKPTEPPISKQPQTPQLPLSKNKRLQQFPGILTAESLQNKKAVIQTTKGIIQLQIYPEATMAASNFILLAANGFYDNLTFHRVEDWVVQGGDPLGNGTGGPGYTEVEKNIFGQYERGVVAYAKRSDEPAGSFGSQFFIMLKDYPLPLEYAIFGKVLAGMDVLDRITVGDIMQRVVIQNLQQ